MPGQSPLHLAAKAGLGDVLHWLTAKAFPFPHFRCSFVFHASKKINYLHIITLQQI